MPDKPDTLFSTILLLCFATDSRKFLALLLRFFMVSVVQLSRIFFEARRKKKRRERGTNIFAAISSWISEKTGKRHKKTFSFSVRVLRLFLSRWEADFPHKHHNRAEINYTAFFFCSIVGFGNFSLRIFIGEFQKIHFNIMRSTFLPFFIFPF